MRPIYGTIVSHSMNSDTGLFACPSSQAFMKSGTDSRISWKRREKNEIQSANKCLQIRNLESHGFSTVTHLMFNPLHTTLLRALKMASAEYFSRNYNHSLPIRNYSAY